MEIRIYNRKDDLLLTDEQVAALADFVCQEIDLDGKSCDIIFVDDKKLAAMHAEYLNDPTETDVITFDLGDDQIEGEIYISHEAAKAQAVTYHVSYDEEVLRLIIHGLLHLKGYTDTEPGQKKKMKAEEDCLLGKTRIEVSNKFKAMI